ncbi:MAG: hypothetical protein ACI8S3_000795 [Alphaproteobacteria bacterium]|jgi:hypothetical protein
MRIPGPALILPLFLAGCALPPALTVASLVAGGVSYVTTGKGTTDHAISAFAGEDCALHRVVNDKPVCDPDGDVLLALIADDPANENWNWDPETGSIDPYAVTRWGSDNELQAKVEQDAAPLPQLAATPDRSRILGVAANAIPTLTPGPVGHGNNLPSQAAAISVAAKPSTRGLFADASPAPKPQIAQLPIQTVSQFANLTLQDGQLTTFAVIGSFKKAENAKRMAATHGDGVMIQAIVVNGDTTYRVLVDKPLEQARLDGFSDAWPVFR